jgi:hypothetical protein
MVEHEFKVHTFVVQVRVSFSCLYAEAELRLNFFLHFLFTSFATLRSFSKRPQSHDHSIRALLHFYSRLLALQRDILLDFLVYIRLSRCHCLLDLFSSVFTSHR